MIYGSLWRLCLSHKSGFFLLFCSLFKSPVSGATKEKHVLQIGCGDGSWCVDMALMYPEWSVLGIDDTGPAPIQGKRTPRNFSYVRYASLLKGLKTLSDQQFDFVYGRFLGFYNKPAYYEKLIKECWRVCKPGGYVEMVELDMHIYGNPALGPMTHSLNGKGIFSSKVYVVLSNSVLMRTFFSVCIVVRKMKSRSIDPQVATHLQDFFFNELLGQPRIRGDGYSTHYISLPLGVWGGRLGVMFRDDLHDIIEYWEEEDDAIRTNQELDSALDTLDVELEREKAFMNLHYVYAQKL
ncbi:uncharacterized protein BYT42DRAFT_268434 [Radiomyces spectabilis]|uniref:uncharacterized protein n=1 Tax=Radiomyces spectabilis TaxID=64574 RepID=UPI002220A9C3|nr:uncharacterized protein BYT42DRAFT_268434 [Radiomyces spectabilis]KAI8384627.1 hypothetical protein BYT42DRAFT_268434 [Radiomyces spectabilis]